MKKIVLTVMSCMTLIGSFHSCGKKSVESTQAITFRFCTASQNYIREDI